MYVRESMIDACVHGLESNIIALGDLRLGKLFRALLYTTKGCSWIALKIRHYTNAN